MEQTEFKVEASELTFRVAKMNAIEALAFQTGTGFQTVDRTRVLFAEALERIEVKIGETWLKVKEKGREVYYPVGIENNFMAIKQIIDYFLGTYLKPLFTKSNVSSKKPE